MARHARARLVARIGMVGVLLAFLFTVAGLVLVGRTAGALADGLSVTRQAVESLSATTEAVESAFLIAEEGLQTVEVTVGGSANSLVELAGVMSNLADLVVNEIPASVEAIEAAMPGLIDTAAVIDRTMRTLSALTNGAGFGVDYDPEKPLDEGLEAVAASLAVIPAELREQQPVLIGASEDLVIVATQSRTISTDIGDLRTRLAEVSALVASYQDTASEAAELLSELEASVVAAEGWGRLLVIVAGGALAAGPLGVLMLGRALVPGSALGEPPTIS